MKYFSGFCLSGEKVVFSKVLDGSFIGARFRQTPYDVVGFSYGAQLAVDFAYNLVVCGCRVGYVRLISPAFFDDRDEHFVASQIMAYRLDPDRYRETFLKLAGLSLEAGSWVCDGLDLSSFIFRGTSKDLRRLFSYCWTDPDVLDKVSSLSSKSCGIEVYLGGMDRVINPHSALDFFAKFGTVFFVKELNHFLLKGCI